MQIVIDIPEGLRDAFNHEEQWTVLLCADMRDALVSGTPIPDNATNGDVIKAIFPNSDIEEHRTYMKIVEGDYLLPCAYLWWNAPYQKGGKE